MQALYTIYRLLTPEAQDKIFCPEGKEDLDILNEEGTLLEAVQVKSSSSNPRLFFSTLEPRKTNSFFRRSLLLFAEHPFVRVKLVSFIPVSQDFENDNMISKLIDNGYTKDEASLLAKKVQVETVEEDMIRQKVFDYLKNSLGGIDPDITFDVLNNWIYLASERRQQICRDDLLNRISEIGKFLSDKRAYHEEWFTSVFPLEYWKEDINEEHVIRLKKEYYSGVSARPDHILAELDISRMGWLKKIKSAFTNSNIVIIHGASGQGKTSLALRYLFDYCPLSCSFQVKFIENRVHAARIARALNGYASILGVPMFVYIDVDPKDYEWPHLVRELVHQKNLYTLVTIREEDWQRASIKSIDVDFQEIELTLDQAEAKQFYNFLVKDEPSEKVLDFDDAWLKSGSKGPLMEFAYLIREGQFLRDRLEKQVCRLQEEVRQGIEPHQVELLRLVSVASAFGARLETKKLIKRLKLRDPLRTFQLLEKEYLIRQTEGGLYVEGLHPIRSAILSDILLDPVITPLEDIAGTCLELIPEEDWEVFLLHYFSRCLNSLDGDLLSLLDNCRNPCTWTGIAGVLRSLLWLGIKQYVSDHSELIEELWGKYGPSLFLIMGPDIFDAIPGVNSEIFDVIKNNAEILNYWDRIKERRNITDRAKAWMESLTDVPVYPNSPKQWRDMAEVAFWVGRLNIHSSINQWLEEIDPVTVVKDLDIGVLSEVIYGLYSLGQDKTKILLKNRRDELIDKYREETKTIQVKDDGERIALYYLLDLEQQDPKIKNIAHSETMKRIELIRFLLPDRDYYAAQGYGYQHLSLPFDDTKKDIPARNLPVPWLTERNAIFQALINWNFRPDNWVQYVEQIIYLREQVVKALENLVAAIERSLRKKQYVNPLELMDRDLWINSRVLLVKYPLLPKCAVDEWGFTNEFRDVSGNNPDSTQISRESLALYKYHLYLDARRDYCSSLGNFFHQVPQVLLQNYRQELLGDRKEKLDDLSRLSVVNITNSIKRLKAFQREFSHFFGEHISPGILKRLEYIEDKTLKGVWSLWFYYVSQPGKIKRYGIKFIQEQEEKLLKRFRSSFRKVCSSFAGEGIYVKPLKANALWNGNRTIWVTIDVSKPEEMCDAFQRVIEAFTVVMQNYDLSEFERSWLDIYYPAFNFISLIHGKALASNCYQIPLYFLSGQGFENNWWHYVPHEIPNEVWNQLGLQLWDIKDIQEAQIIIANFIKISLLLEHLTVIEQLDNVDSVGYKLVNQYITLKMDSIQRSLQEMINILILWQKNASVFPDIEIKENNSIFIRQLIDAFKEFLCALKYGDKIEVLDTWQKKSQELNCLINKVCFDRINIYVA
ncbi:MAG TPA: hypothetical protein DDY74_01520 [Pseudothermotoga sp.]|nr:hypothetical protein [Pseudothermotoga sp.]